MRQPIWQIGQQLIRLMLDILDAARPPQPACTLLDPAADRARLHPARSERATGHLNSNSYLR